MNPKWINILGILVFYQKMASGAGDGMSIKEGMPVEITCRPHEEGSMVIWFRVLDKHGMEFIASFSSSGLRKSRAHTSFSDTKIEQHIITLQAFKKASDSGVYSCASLVRGTELKFGEVTRLVGEEERGAKVTTTTIAAATRQSQFTTATACDCTNNEKTEAASPFLFCTPFILGPLVGGCGLLLLLLIITTMYCNKMRTRRCPHHYKRKSPILAVGIQ